MAKSRDRGALVEFIEIFSLDARHRRQRQKIKMREPVCYWTDRLMSLSLWERHEALTIHKTKHGPFMKRHFVDWICILTIFDITNPLWNLNHDFCAFFGQYSCKKKLLRLFDENSNFQTVLQIYFLSIQSTLHILVIVGAALLLLHLKLRLMYKGVKACHKILWKNSATFELILLEQESAYIMELVSCK